MSLANLFLDYRYVFTFGTVRSKEYLSARTAAHAGMEEIRVFGARYVIDHSSDPPLTRRDYRATVRRVTELLSKDEVGEVYRVQNAERDPLPAVRFRVVGKQPKPSERSGTPACKRWMGYVEERWPKARFAGSVVCKPLDHGKGAAADYFDTDKNMRAQRDFAVQYAGWLDVKYAILYDTIWTAGPPHTEAPRGYHNYSGQYHSHVHVSLTDGKCGVFCTPGPGAC